MKILRDLRLSTELLILFEVLNDPHIKLKNIASKLNITVQGASDYIRRMKRDGKIQNIGGELRATKKGIDFLHSNFSELKEFVDLRISELNIVDVCAALARTPIKEGDEVGLFMEDGILTAYARRKSKSTGIAISSAEPEEDVAVKDLSGMVSLSPGIIHIVRVPSINEGGSAAVSESAVKKLYKTLSPDKIGILDVVSHVCAKKAGLKSDFEFASLEAAIEATEKGLNVMLLTSSDRIHQVVSSIESINSQIEDKIVYEIVIPRN